MPGDAASIQLKRPSQPVPLRWRAATSALRCSAAW